MLTALVDIVLALLHLCLERPVKNPCLLWHRSIALGKNGKLVPWYVELLYRFPNNLLAYPTRINVGGIPGWQAYSWWFNLQMFQYISTCDTLPLSHAAFNNFSPSSSSTTQFCQSLLPIPMVPRIGEETRIPEDPNWTYSTLVASKLFCSEAGTGGAGIFCVFLICFFAWESFWIKCARSIDILLTAHPHTTEEPGSYIGRGIHRQIEIGLIVIISDFNHS